MTAISPDRIENASPIQRGIREALYAGAISFGLFFLLIGVKTDQNIRNELILVPRWGLLAIVVGLVMVGRFLIGRLPAALFRRAQGGAGESPAGRADGKVPVLEALVQDRHRRADPLPGRHRDAGRLPGLAEMGRQFRHPDPDLRDARLGAEHRGRARRPARSRLRRLLRGRRLLLRAARHRVRLVVLDPAAGRRRDGGVLGRHPRLPGAAAARRLPRHRDARLRRDHTARHHQLDRGDQRHDGAFPASRRSPSSACSTSTSRRPTTSPRSSASRSRAPTTRSSSTT